MLNRIIAALVVVVALFGTIAAFQPDQFKVERQIAIAAQPDAIFPLVNDFRQTFNWSPWADLDPAMSKSFEGAVEGPGSIYTWDGNEAVGAGRMTITESVADERVRMKLENYRPFESTSTVDIVLTPGESATVVTWSLSGRLNFLEKAFSVFVDMDNIIGPDFERGLTRLKALAEATVG